MKVYHHATMGDPDNGCYYTSNAYLRDGLRCHRALAITPEEADIIYITENCGGLKLFKNFPEKTKVLQLVCSHPKTYCSLLKKECEDWGVWDERPFMWAPTRQEEIDLADYVLVYSKFSAREAIKHGVPKNKIVIIPKGVETGVFKPYEENKREGYTVLMPGQQFVMKGLQYAMKAYEELKNEGFNFKLVLCGDKTRHMAKDKKTRKFEMGKFIPGEVTNHGRVKRDELIKLYNEADVVLCPSVEDSFNMTVLEALSCDKPVITTKNTGAGELIQHHVNGSIIPIRSVKAIKKEIKYWKNNEPKQCRSAALTQPMSKYVNDVINLLKHLK